jgi:hypothetical protein
MKKQYFMGLIGGMVAFTLLGCISTDKITEEVTNKVQEVTDEVVANMPQKCTIEGEETSGVTYTDGERYFSEGTGLDGQYFYALIDGEYTYMWTADSEVGSKVRIELDEDEEDFDYIEYLEEESEDDTQFNCEPWIVDSSKFEVPDNIVFEDFSDMFEDFELNMEELDYEI